MPSPLYSALSLTYPNTWPLSAPLKFIFSRPDFNGPPPPPDRPLFGPNDGQPPCNPLSRIVLFIASFVLVASFVTIFDGDSAAVQCYTTAVGKQWTVPLRDGSLIKLNTYTRLCLRQDGTNLYATLYHGEALFTMRPAPNSHRRLIVSAGDLDVIDVATIFSVRITDHGAVNIAVGEGTVQLSSATFSPRELRENQLAEVGERGTALPIIRDVSPDLIRKQLSWRDGILFFEQEPFSKVAQELNRYNRTKIVIAEPTLANAFITGAFTPTDLFAFAAGIAASNNARWISAQDENGAPILLFSRNTPPTLPNPAPSHHRSDTTPHTR